MVEFGSSEAGKKGGKARAEKMTPAERSERAAQAALKRWGKELPMATHEGVLQIGNAEITCYVLENGDRMMSSRGIMQGLGRAWRGRKYSGTQLPVFLEAKNLKPFIDEELLAGPAITKFLTPAGRLAEGCKAQLMPHICNTYLKARDAHAPTESQHKVAIQADMLMRGFAHVGIIALVDEATGFQDERDRRALAIILEKFIAKELRKWVKTFPLDYYQQLCRLKEIPFSTSMKMPQYFGHITNDLIYSRLAPCVLRELKRVNPSDGGRRKNRHHQHLSENIGHPKLLQHLGSVVTLMKISPTWEKFYDLIEQIHPVQKDLPLFDSIDQD